MGTSQGPLCAAAQNKRKEPTREGVEHCFGWAGEEGKGVEPIERERELEGDPAA